MIAALAVLGALNRGSAGTPPPDDDALLARHRAGDPNAFEAIYRAYAAAVYRRLTRIVGPIPEREDLTQDVFLGVHRALPRFRGDAKLSTLVHRIAINRACEYLRRRSARPFTVVDDGLLDDVIGTAYSPEHHSAVREELLRVLDCLAKIKVKKRVAFLLRVVDNLSFEEIGELVDATPETVAKRVQHAHRELTVQLARAARHQPRGHQ